MLSESAPIGWYDRSPGSKMHDISSVTRSSFEPTASAVVRHLDDQLAMDLWLVTRARDHEHVVISSAGSRRDLAEVGQPFCWPTLLPEVDRRRGTSSAADLADPRWSATGTTDPLGALRPVIVVPLRGDDGQMVGSLAAFGARPPRRVPRHLTELAVLLGSTLGAILVAEDLTRTHWEAASRATALAERDRLTGLRNRHGWDAALVREDAKTQRTGSPTSVIVLDLDDLKRTNDSRGHSAGDDLLVRCAEILAQGTRPGDTSARLGGDEFGLLASECDAGHAGAVLSRIRLALRAGGVNASAGCATRLVGEDLRDTWRRADEAMYLDKRERDRGRLASVASIPDQRTGRGPIRAAEPA